jgi:sulfite reductase beta subunit-like hemoprotein
VSVPRRPLKVALIGAGNVASFHLPAYVEHRDEVELVAVCDVDERAAAARARQGGACSVYADLETLLREEEVEALDICTPHDLHAEHAIAAAEALVEVFIEHGDFENPKKGRMKFAVDALGELGIEHLDMPLTPELLWRAIHETEQRKAA